MSNLRVASLRGRKAGTAPKISGGTVITGVATATSLIGDASGLSGIDATALKDSGGSVKVQANTSGVVVTGVSTFSGNVSVGKTLTYEDVTNIDSVGVVTARAGIKIGAGQSVSAVSGIVTYYGDGSLLTGIESGVVNFVASGTIANGQTVVINTDGTVGIVTLTTSNTPSVGSEVVFESAAITYPAATFDSSNNKVVIAYRDDGNNEYGTAVVGTVSGTSISFGTPVVYESATTSYTSATYDSSNGKVVIAYRDHGNSQRGTSIVGTVSGTSISFGTAVVIDSTPGVSYISATYDSTNNKVVIAYRDEDNSNYGRAVVGTVSGTSISFGSPVTFESGESGYISAIYDSANGKVVIAYKDYGNNEYGTAVVGTVSGISISFGSAVTFASADTRNISCTYDGSDKVIIAYRDQPNSNYGTVILGTVSGTSISFGSEVVFNAGTTTQIASTYDSTNDNPVIAFSDDSNSSHGTAVVLSHKSTNLTAENYIGIAAEAISNGATGKINVVTGINDGQTGLTTAQKYFVQTNGTLSTSAGDPSVVAGTAISDTKIIVQKS